MNRLFFLKFMLLALTGCTQPLMSHAQVTPPVKREQTPAMAEALKGFVNNYDSSEVFRRNGLYYAQRKELYGGEHYSKESKTARIMDGYSLIYTPDPHQPAGSLAYRYYTLSRFVAGRREGVWEYYTPAGQLFKREEYRRGKRKRVEQVP